MPAEPYGGAGKGVIAVASSAYIFVSFIIYLFDVYPNYMHYKEQPEYTRFFMEQIWGKKALRRFHKAGFYVATANLIVCCLLLVLKCVGYVEWW